MIDDGALVRSILSGDLQAFRLLIKQHERLVAHMVGRLVKNVEDREELCQDVFMKVHSKLGDFNFQSRLSTWIATIAYRHAINHLKKSRLVFSDIPDENRFTEALAEPDNPEMIVADNDIEAHLLRLIDKLPGQYRVVLSLYHVEGMSYAEIGEITGQPDGTVKSYLFRARNLLKEKMNKYLKNEELL